MCVNTTPCHVNEPATPNALPLLASVGDFIAVSQALEIDISLRGCAAYEICADSVTFG